MKNGTKNIILISDQILLRGANQVLFQTIRGLLEDSYNVCLIFDGNTGHEKENIATIEELFPSFIDRIELHYYQAYFSIFFDFLKKIRDIFLNFRQNIPTNLEVKFAHSNAVNGFDNTRTGFTFISDLKYTFKWMAAYRTAKKAALKFSPNVICGFEIGGSIPAEKLSKKLNIPFFTKYMGTIVYPYLKENNLQAVKPFVKGLKVKPKLHFMLNDGTRGKEVLQKLGANPDTIRFRIDGVDKLKFKNLPNREKCIVELKLDIQKNDFVCLCLSNHNASYKRLERAVRAILKLSKSIDNIKLLMVGTGRNTAALKKLANSSGKNNSIVFIPKLSYGNIPYIHNISDIYLNTNDESNLSHPVLEAMYIGKTVVSMDDGSLDGIIENHFSGILVNPENCHKELPEAIQNLYNDRDLLDLIASNARAFAHKSFYSWDEKNRIELDEINDLL